jgi:hypothetical protein
LSGFRADLDTGDIDVRLTVSMRSKRGPEPVLSKVEGMCFWQRLTMAWEQVHSLTGSPNQPQGQGFMAPMSTK